MTISKHTLNFLDSWLMLRSKWSGVPGFAVALASHGKIIFDKAYGQANLETEEELTVDHIFHVASHSKTFTATAIMQLQENGKLRIDNPVVQYLDWLKDHKDKRWQEVTVRQLLSHSAGVMRDGFDNNFWQLVRSFPNSAELRQIVMEADLILEPNTTMKYSNIGYSLLGEVVVATSGLAYNDYVTEFIIRPLDLNHTTPEYDSKQLLVSSHSRIDLDRRRYSLPQQKTWAMSPATGFCSTAADLATYFSAHSIGSGRLLSDTSKREMQRLQWNIPNVRNGGGYGLGFQLKKYSKSQTFGHSGGWPGQLTCSAVDPRDDLVVVFLTNCQDSRPISAVDGIFSIINKLGASAPTPDFAKYEGRFTNFNGVSDIVAREDELLMLPWSNNWKPFDLVYRLKQLDSSTFRYIKAAGYTELGESIQYHFDSQGAIDHITNRGMTMIPSLDGRLPKTWLKQAAFDQTGLGVG